MITKGFALDKLEAPCRHASKALGSVALKLSLNYLVTLIGSADRDVNIVALNRRPQNSDAYEP